MMHEQDTLTRGSVISHTELAFASIMAACAAIDELFSLLLLPDDDDEEVGVEDAFEEGSVLMVTTPPLSPTAESGDCCGGGTVGVACMIQSCQTRSGMRTAGELLINAEDMLL